MEIHLLTIPRPSACARLLVLHGAGGHSGALWPLAALADQLGYEVFAPDLPGYGLTKVPNRYAVTYNDWIDCASSYVQRLTAHDKRPLIILGASMGGMLGYSVSALQPGSVAHLISTCFLDPSNPNSWPALSRFGGGSTVRFFRTILGSGEGRSLFNRFRLPMRWIAPMKAIANDPKLAQICQEDQHGGGSSVSIGFIASYLYSEPSISPEQFKNVPVTLIHPNEDRWTPTSMSYEFFQRIASPKRFVPLLGCGHFPVEEPGLSDAVGVLKEVLEGFATTKSSSFSDLALTL